MSGYPSTIRDCIKRGAQLFREEGLFFGHGTNNSEDEALWLVFHALSLPFDSDQNVLNHSVTRAQWIDIQTLYNLRVLERLPTAYITGQAWFCGHAFKVNEHVLVPRSPIAELIYDHYQPWLMTTPRRILDLCTGCGCIGIASALALPNTSVDLADISHDALDVAQKNIELHHLESRVTAFHSDLFSALAGKEYDLIVTNPPYVDSKDLALMPDEYHAEPAIALGSGDDGLDITRRILREAAHYLSDKGSLIVELGNSWENLEEAFPNIPFLWLNLSNIKQSFCDSRIICPL